MSIRDLAREAYARAQAEEAEEEARRQARALAKEKARQEERTETTRKAATALFGVEPEQVHGLDCMFDGVHLKRVEGQCRWFHLVGVCAGCGGEVVDTGWLIDGLASLGRRLADGEGEPWYHAACRPAASEPEESGPPEGSQPLEPDEPLATRALRAHEEQVAQHAAAEREQIARIWWAKFGCAPEAIEGMTVRHEGMTLEYTGYGDFRLGGVCPRCGQAVLSDLVQSLSGLGALLARFEPCVEHRDHCPANPTATATASFEQRLVALLDERYGCD